MHELRDALGLVLLVDEALARLGRARDHGDARRRERLIGQAQLLEEIEELVEGGEARGIDRRRRLEVHRGAIEGADRSREIRGDEAALDLARLLGHRVLEGVERQRGILEVIAEERPEQATELPRHLAPHHRIGDPRRALEHPPVGQLELAPLLPLGEESRDHRQRLEHARIAGEGLVEELERRLFALEIVEQIDAEREELLGARPHLLRVLGDAAPHVDRVLDRPGLLVEKLQPREHAEIIGPQLGRALERRPRAHEIPAESCQRAPNSISRPKRSKGSLTVARTRSSATCTARRSPSATLRSSSAVSAVRCPDEIESAFSKLAMASRRFSCACLS